MIWFEGYVCEKYSSLFHRVRILGLREEDETRIHSPGGYSTNTSFRSGDSAECRLVTLGGCFTHEHVSAGRDARFRRRRTGKGRWRPNGCVFVRGRRGVQARENATWVLVRPQRGPEASEGLPRGLTSGRWAALAWRREERTGVVARLAEVRGHESLTSGRAKIWSGDRIRHRRVSRAPNMMGPSTHSAPCRLWRNTAANLPRDGLAWAPGTSSNRATLWGSLLKAVDGDGCATVVPGPLTVRARRLVRPLAAAQLSSRVIQRASLLLCL